MAVQLLKLSKDPDGRYRGILSDTEKQCLVLDLTSKLLSVQVGSEFTQPSMYDNFFVSIKLLPLFPINFKLYGAIAERFRVSVF